MSIDLDAIRERTQRARSLFVSGDGYPVPSYAAAIVRDDAPDLLAEIERLDARLNAAHEALAIDEFDGDSCITLETTIEYAVRQYRLVCESEASAADEIQRLRGLLGQPCPHGHYGTDRRACGPCSFDAVKAAAR